jgi:hypothetical protein
MAVPSDPLRVVACTSVGPTDPNNREPIASQAMSRRRFALNRMRRFYRCNGDRRSLSAYPRRR